MTVETETLAPELATITPAFPRYPAYRDSGVEWLGEIPVHWTNVRLRRLLRQGDGLRMGPFGSQLKLEDMVLSGIKVYGQEHVINGNFDHGKKYVTLAKFEAMKEFAAQPGDLLVSMMGTSGRCRQVPLYAELGMIDSHLLRLRLNEDVDSHFAALVIDQAPYVRDQFDAMGKGAIMQGLNSSLVKSVILALPPLSEQRAIAAYLDRETARIDALVAAKERLIALLQEKRAALISHAVTRGLNPTAPMKDSGVPWLGEIPAHWDAKALGYALTYISYGFTNPMPATDDGPYMLTALDIGDGLVKYDTARHTTEKAFTSLLTNKSRPCKGDILLTKDGTLGRVAVHDGTRACINQSVAILRTVRGIVSPDYLCRLLAASAYQDRMVFDAGGTTIKHIYISKIVKMPVAFPPPDEQQQILCYLDRETAKLDTLIAKIRQHIEKVKEYRAALISAAITGKIDVTGSSTIDTGHIVLGEVAHG